MSNVRDLILKIKKLQELAAQEAKKSSYQSLKKSPQSATKVNLNPEHGKKIESDLEKNRDSEDDYVYHSTYLKNLKSIAQHGLGSYGTHKIKRAWPGIQDPNHTYLATDPDVAHDYSEVSDFASDSDIDNIVTFRIHKKHLHPDHIHPDRNDSSSENIAYSKQIPPEHLEIHYDNTENGNANKLWQKHLNLRRAQATKKQELEKDAIPGGLADNKKLSDSDSKELEEGTRVEMEHTSDPEIAQEIAQDHLTEDPLYYQKLKTIEKKTLEKAPTHYDIDDVENVALTPYQTHSKLISKTTLPGGLEHRVKTHPKNPKDFVHTLHRKGSSQPLAQMHVETRRHEDTEQYEPTVSHSVVNPKHKGKGFGKLLYQQAVKYHGELTSDSSISRRAHKMWRKLSNKKAAIQTELADYNEYDETPHRAYYYGESGKLEKGARGDWKKEGYTFEHEPWAGAASDEPYNPDRHDFCIKVKDKEGKEIGYGSFVHEGARLYPAEVGVQSRHRRKGIATHMYNMAQELSNKHLYPSALLPDKNPEDMSDDAHRFWERRLNIPKGQIGKTEVIISIYEEEPLEKAEEFPTGPRQTHSTKGYQSARWNNEWVWQHGPEIASNHDRYINDPKLIRSMINKMPTPQHKKAMEVVIQRIQNDPNRHVIPTHDREKNRHILRARHLKSLLLNDDNFNIDTSKPNQLKITAKQRHGLATGPTDFIFNIKESPNVQKSIRDDQGRDQVRSGSLRPGFGHDLEPGRDPGSDVNPSGTGSNPGRRNAELNLLQHLLEDKRPHWSKAYHDHKHLVTPYVKEDQSKYLKNKPISDIMVRHSGSHVHESLNNRNSPEGQLVIKMLEEGQLRYHPKTGFLLNNFRTATENLQRSESAPVNLIHFSRVKGLKSIDPHYMGTGAPSQETRHGVPEVRRSYFYRADSEPEHLVTQGAVSKYHVTLPETHKLYDLANDHEGHIKSAVEANNGAYNSDMVLGKIRDAGYHGFYNSKSSLPNVVALFHSTPVHREEMP